MRSAWIKLTLAALVAMASLGCRSNGKRFVAYVAPADTVVAEVASSTEQAPGTTTPDASSEQPEITLTAHTDTAHTDAASNQAATEQNLPALPDVGSPLKQAIRQTLGQELGLKRKKTTEAEPAAAKVKQASAAAEAATDSKSQILLLPSVIDTPSTDEPTAVNSSNDPADSNARTTVEDTTAEVINTPAGQPNELNESELVEPSAAMQELVLGQVVNSVRNHFPLIQLAFERRTIASGEALSAWGAFDRKLDLFSESQPLDFYENYRHSVGLKRDTYWGGQVFAGYRIGRGIYEPWYLERETNKGGEFKAGFKAPIIRDRVVDANRSALWQAQLEQRRVEPAIFAQVIQFVREGSIAYWNWVAAGANYRINEGLLELALQRNEGLVAQVEAEEKAPIDLVDNRRIIVSREAKLIDARRKLEQTTVKLSLYFRSTTGDPLLADVSLLPDVAVALTPPTADNYGFLPDDAQQALLQRPELAELQIVRQQLNIALQQAKNETLPDVDAGLLLGQDVGEPTSSKRDKSEFEVEAMLTLSVPLERRKAMGKIRSLRGKMAQVTAKNRFAADKVVAEVRIARAALQAAVERMERASESFELAQQMQEAEQERFDLGQSSLFNLNEREKQLAEAAVDRVAAMLEYHIALADYAAAMGLDQPLMP